MAEKQKITVEATIAAPVEKVWKLFSEPEHIRGWNFASTDWHTPKAENDLKVGGKFVSRMEAKDGSAGFDFTGTYDEVKENELISYSMEDGRKVEITFAGSDNETKFTETFDADDQHSVEMQQGGWQAIVDNFKKYVEEN